MRACAAPAGTLRAAGASAARLLLLATRTRPHTPAGDWVLVHAAAGGTGQLLTQILAHQLKARVIGTTSTPNKAAAAKACGAQEVRACVRVCVCVCVAMHAACWTGAWRMCV
jgi:NADPH:quinone reductase-like Zn-dependent oxidoreductase